MTVPVGTISEGTLRTEDLVEAFLGFLDEHAPDQAATLRRWEVKEDNEWFLWEVVVPEMEELAPAGYYFGPHPGDGADFGFWKEEVD